MVRNRFVSVINFFRGIHFQCKLVLTLLGSFRVGEFRDIHQSVEGYRLINWTKVKRLLECKKPMMLTIACNPEASHRR